MSTDSVCAIIQESPLQTWKKVLEAHFESAIYRSWLSQLQVDEFLDGNFVFLAPSPFMKNWIDTHYLSSIRKLFSHHFPEIKSLCIRTSEAWQPIKSQKTALDKVFAKERNYTIASNSILLHESFDIKTSSSRKSYGSWGQKKLFKSLEIETFPSYSSSLEKDLTFDEFIVDGCNAFAYAAAKDVVQAEKPVYNPVFLHGPMAHGKTHLMQSIAHGMRQHAYHRNVLYLSAENFMRQFVQALRHHRIMEFKDRLRSLDVLMVEDVQFMAGKASTQQEFFHTFNELMNANCQIILSSNQAPHQLRGLDEEIKSRFSWGLIADLRPTTFELRLKILQKKVSRQSFPVCSETLEFLAATIDRNVRELEGALNCVIAHSVFIGKKLSLEGVKQILENLFEKQSKPDLVSMPLLQGFEAIQGNLSLEHIQTVVCKYFKLEPCQLLSEKRSRHIVRPRQIAMFLSKQFTSLSLPQIGRYFGGKDHTTVLHAICKVQERLSEEETLRKDLNILRQYLENR